MQVSGTLSAPLDAFLDAPSVTVRNTRNNSIFSFPRSFPVLYSQYCVYFTFHFLMSKDFAIFA